MSRRPDPGLDPRVLTMKSKKLSWLLRHGARESGLSMDTAGFAPIDQVLRKTGMSRAELDAVVAENNKSRFEVRGADIRAVQGHSCDGTPVTMDGLERTWEEVVTDEPLYHGTSVAAARSILEGEGVHSAARTHVHLAPEVDAKVGKRAGVDVLLVISPRKLREQGGRVFRAPNGVLLCRVIPKQAITGLVAGTAAGERALGQLRSCLASGSRSG